MYQNTKILSFKTTGAIEVHIAFTHFNTFLETGLYGSLYYILVSDFITQR